MLPSWRVVWCVQRIPQALCIIGASKVFQGEKVEGSTRHEIQGRATQTQVAENLPGLLLKLELCLLPRVMQRSVQLRLAKMFIFLMRWEILKFVLLAFLRGVSHHP